MGRLTRGVGSRPARESAGKGGGVAVCRALVLAAVGLTGLAGGCRSAPQPGPPARLAPARPAAAGAGASGGTAAPAPDWVK